MPHTQHVFFDSSGRRARITRLVAGLVAVAALLLLGGFVFTLVRAPSVGPARARHANTSGYAARPRIASVEKKLFARIAKDERANRPRALVEAGRIAGAYYAPWDTEALDAFKAHAADLTHVYPVWLGLTPDGGSLSLKDWLPSSNPNSKVVIATARANGLRIVPVISNASQGVFNSRVTSAMLDDPAKAAAVSEALAQFVHNQGFDGLQIDFELLAPAQVEKLAPWMAGLRRRLHAENKELSVTLEADLAAAQVRSLAGAADYAVLMAYDEHSDFDPPGPIASASFVDRTLRRFTGLVASDKLVLGVAGYGYDWKKGAKSADSITNAEALALAAGYRDDEKAADVIDFDGAALEATFQYDDDDGVSHTVWFHDAVSTANDMTLARSYHLRGAALWALGQEDPSSWAAMGRQGSADPDLRTVTAAQAVTFNGDGELLRIVARPRVGARTYERDKVSGLIEDETYVSYANGWLIHRRGNPAKTVALTFDDGPDPKWTPKILDVLKRRHVPGTFFMIGEEAAKHPHLVRRVFAEGHEIGNHSYTHPNMAHVSEQRVRLELTACQRVIEFILLRQMTLFRPPYNADSEPDSYGQIMPVAVADEMGYVTAGEFIDPTDWDLQRTAPDGSVHRLRGDEIVQAVLAQVDRGQAVLLHDAGGDRSATLAALDPLIDALQARGYRFVTIGELEGRGREVTMPLLPASQRRSVEIDGLTFALSRALQGFLFVAFSTAIILGLARISLMIGLAARRRPRATSSTPGPPPRVDVLVAAFNEAQVIARTIDSLLAQADVEVRVIVVDDGSTDGTAEVVREGFAHDRRVLLLAKPNGGKASALNLALSAATAEVVVGVDADTQLDSEALALLCAWFADPHVAAVAGNVRVGNATGLVTRWQSIEYTTSQNIDRRAMARLNAITVVPGAIGGWRRTVLADVGGYGSDTLAEDMDLTWRVREAGWVIANEPGAIAYTEAPDTLGGLFKQRFRWTFGTLQCLWKHRRAVFHQGWFGGLALPSLWLFQIVGQILAPLIDLQLLVAVVSRLMQWIASRQHSDIELAPDPTAWFIVVIYLLFMALEFAAGWVAYGFDRADRRELWLLPTQRLVYRQIMYLVVWSALLRALGGLGQAWGKLRRTGTVSLQGR